MEPKFQSSFIPKGPIASAASGVSMGQRTQKKSLLAHLASLIFTASVLLALGMFGYKFYLNYSIEQMGADLENARATLEPEVIRELTRLDNRLISSKSLVMEHQILSPLFEFLAVSTLRMVRFSDFHYSVTEQGLELSMVGEARGYAALALQADIFNKSQYFKDSIFSNLALNTRGNVNFSFKTIVDPSLVSYQREVERIGAPIVVPIETVVSTSTSSTSSPQAATSTPNQNEE